MKRLLATATLIAFFISIIPNSYAAVTAGTKCTKVNTKQSYKNRIYTCIKLGNKLYWNDGAAIKNTATKASQKAKPEPKAISNFSSTSTDGGFNYSFSYQPNYPVLNYEIGYATLTNANLESSSDANYKNLITFQILNSTSFSLKYQDLNKLFTQDNAASTGQAILIKVRASTTGGITKWSNGIYVTYQSLLLSLALEFRKFLNDVMEGGL